MHRHHNEGVASELRPRSAKREGGVRLLKPDIRVVETVVVENGAFVGPLPKTGVVTKSAKLLIVHSTHKNKGFCSSDHGPRKSTKMRNMARVTQAKMTVWQKHRFGQPRKGRGCSSLLSSLGRAPDYDTQIISFKTPTDQQITSEGILC